MKEIKWEELLKHVGGRFPVRVSFKNIQDRTENDGPFLAVDNVWGWGDDKERPRQPPWYYLWIYYTETDLTYNYERGNWGWPKGSARLIGNCDEDKLILWLSLSPEDLTYLKFSGKTDHLLFKVI